METNRFPPNDIDIVSWRPMKHKLQECYKDKCQFVVHFLTFMIKYIEQEEPL